MRISDWISDVCSSYLPKDRVESALAVGLAGALAFGLMFGLRTGFQRFPSANRIARKVPARTRWPIGLMAGLAFGLVVGQIGSASCRERVDSTWRSRCSP